MRIIRGMLSWLLALFLLAVYVNWTIHPLPDPPEGQVIFFDLPGENVFFSLLATRSGVSMFEPTGRMIAGGLELVAAVLMLISPFRRLGAVLSALLCMFLAGVQMSPWLDIELPLKLGESATDEGARFYLTLACLTASLLLFVVHPGRGRHRY